MQARILHDLYDGDGSDIPVHIVAQRGDIGYI